MATYFYGEDTWAARQAIDELAIGATVRWLDREALEERSAAEWIAGAAGGMFGAELPVVRDPARLPKALQEQVQAAAGTASAACVLWDRVMPDRRSAFFKAFKDGARQFAPLPPDELAGWLAGEVKAREGTITAEAARMMVRRLGSDRWLLLSEIERLLLMHTELTENLIEKEIAPLPEAEVFAMLELLVQGKRRQAIGHVEGLLAGGASEFYILSMLAYQFRTLAAVSSGVERGLDQPAIAREGKLKPYSVQKSWGSARQRPASVWTAQLTRVLACDFAIKQGTVDARTGVLMLVSSL